MTMQYSKPKEGKGAPAPLDATAKANLDRLRSLGINVDPKTGEATTTPFQGSPQPDTDPDELGPGVQATVTRTEPFQPDDRIVDDQPELPAEPSAAAPEPPPHEPGAQTPEGLAKREKDAREAQAAFSKAQAKLDKTLMTVEQKMSDLNQKIDQLAALQVTTGGIPPDLNPADAATVAAYRENDPDAVGVMEAIAAPLYAQISSLQDRLSSVVNQVGDFLNEARQEKVLGKVYARIPKEKVDQITESPEFLTWLSETPEPLRASYIAIFNSTAKYSSDAALRALRDFGRDSGIDVGLDNKPAQAPRRPEPQMPTTPALRSGSALPPPAPPHPRTQNEVTPLSPEERASWTADFANARTDAERNLLKARLAATEFNFNPGAFDRYGRDAYRT